MYKLNYILLIIFLFTLNFNVQAYVAYKVQFIYNDTGVINNSIELQQELIIADTQNLPLTVNGFLKKCHTNSYIAAGIDSVVNIDSTYIIYVTLGQSYQWAKINAGNIKPAWLTGTGVLENIYKDKLFNTDKLSEVLDKILYHASVNGYPFAEVMLANTEIFNNEIVSELYIEKNELYTFDSLFIVGEVNINPGFLINYLKIIPGMPYNEDLVNSIVQKLSDLPFIKINRSPLVEFSGNLKARVILFIEEVNVNYFNGIAGFAPNHSMNNKMVLTGEAILNLINPFGRGMHLNFEWRKQRLNTQELKLSANAPYIFSTQFGLETSFRMLKFDTLYNQVAFLMKLRYLFSAQSNCYVFGDFSQSRPANKYEVQSENIIISDQIRYYGLGVEFQKLDNRFNPRKGYHLDVNIAAGTKTLNEDAPIGDDEFAANVSTIYRIAYETGRFFSITPQNIVYIYVKGGHLTDPYPQYSQLYILGGFAGLKGFDEGSILADNYTILNLEYRLLTGIHSHFKLFVNGAWYKAGFKNEPGITDFPYGFGTGYDFKVPNGIFSLNYAIGSEHGNPPDILNAKIHFGFKTLF